MERSLAEVIAGAAIGALEDELADLANVPTSVIPRRRIRFIRRLAKVIALNGDPVIVRKRDREDGVSMKVGVRIVRSEDLIGDLEVGDHAFVVPADPLLRGGFGLPLQKDDEIVLSPNTTKEQVIMVKHKPAAFGLDGVDIVYRGFATG